MRTTSRRNQRGNTRSRSSREGHYLPRLEGLEERTLLAADLNLVKQHLAPVLGGVQPTLDARVLHADLPVLGTALRNYSATRLFTNLQERAAPRLNELPANPTIAQINDKLRAAYAGLLQGDITVTGTEVSPEVTFALTLQQALTPGGAPAPFAIGLPGLGLGLTGTINVTVQAGYAYRMKFGVHETTGFFLDVTNAQDLDLNVNATASTTAANGRLGLLSGSLQSTGSQFNPTYAVNLRGPAGSGDRVRPEQVPNMDASSQLNGNAQIRLLATGAFNAPSLNPRIQATLAVDWNFVNANPQSALGNFGSIPEIRLDNVRLDLGSFFDNYVRPVVRDVTRTVEPLLQVAEMLTLPIPGISRLGIDVTFLEVVARVTEADTSYFTALARIPGVMRALADTSVADHVWIDLGSVNLNDNGVDARRINTPTQIPVNTISPPATPPLQQARGQGGAGFFDAAQTNMPGGGLQFPLLQEPRTAMRLFLGQTVDLFTYELPPLQATFQRTINYNVIIPPFIPATLTLGGSVTFNANLKFGFDSSGVLSGNILDGFFVDFRGNRPLFGLVGRLEVSGGLGFRNDDLGLSLIIAGAGLNLTGTVNFNPRDLPADRKLRFTQIHQFWDQGLGAFFTTTGNINIDFDFFAEARITIPFLGSVSIRKNLLNMQRELFDFDSLGFENSPYFPGANEWLGWRPGVVGSNSDWHNPRNWSHNRVPTAADDVLLGRGVVQVNAPATARTLHVAGGRAGGTGSLTVSDRLELSAGELGGSGDVTVQGQMVWTGGRVSGSGTLRANGGLDLGGRARKVLLGKRLVNVGAAVWTGTGAVLSGEGAVWDNLATGTFDVRTSAPFTQAAGTAPRFNNAGQFVKSAGGVCTLDVSFHNTGTTRVTAGTLNLEKDGTAAGMFTVDAGATLEFGGGGFNLGAGSRIAGAGTVHFSGSGTTTLGGTYAATGPVRVTNGVVRFNGGGTFATLELNGGELAGSGTLTVDGPLTWVQGGLTGTGIVRANGGIVMQTDTAKWIGGGTLENGGLTVWTGNAAIVLFNGGTWRNLATGVLDARNNGFFHRSDASAARFVNDGIVSKTAGTGATVVDAPFTNNGTLRVLTGTVALSGPFTNYANNTLTGGIYDVQATLRFNGADIHTNAATIILNGTAAAARIVDELTPPQNGLRNFTNNTAAGRFTFTGGQGFTPSANFTNAGTVTFGSSGLLHLSSGRTWTNSGRFTWSGTGTLSLVGAMFNNQGTFEAENDAALSGDGGGVFRNAGTFRKAGGLGTTSVGNVTFDSPGIVEIQVGTFRLATTGTFGAAVMLQPGATLEFAGTYTLTPSSRLQGPGRVIFRTGTVTLDGAWAVTGPVLLSGGITVFNTDATLSSLDFSSGNLGGTGVVTITGPLLWTGGSMTGGGRTLANGGMTLSGAVIKSVTSGRTLVNPAGATASWSGTGVLSVVNAVFDNQGTFIAQNDATLSGNANGVFRNAGTFRKATGTGVTPVQSVTFDSPGAVEIQTGTLRLGSDGTFGAAVTFQAGTTLEFAGSYILTASSRLQGAGGVVFRSGTVTLDGAWAVTGPVLLSGGITVFNTDAILSSLDFSSGNLGGAGVVTITGPLLWTGGSMVGGGRTLAYGGMTLSGSVIKSVTSGRTLVNPAGATARWSGTGVLSVVNAVFDNQGTFVAENDATLTGNAGGLFRNAGTFRKTVGLGTTTIQSLAFDSGSGVVEVQTGTLRLGSTGTLGAAVTLQADTTLEFQGTYTLTASGSLQGAGGVIFRSGTITLDGAWAVTGPVLLSGGTTVFNTDATLSSLDFSSGNLGGTGVVTITGPLLWTGGSMTGGGRTLANGGMTLSGAVIKTVTSGRTLVNLAGATARWSGTGVLSVVNAVFDNQGTFVAENDAALSGNASGLFRNAGTFRKAAGAGTTTVQSVTFDNNGGIVEVQTGTLFISGAFPNYAANTLTGGTYLVTGILKFTNADIRTNAAAIMLDGPNALLLNQSNVDGLRNFAVNGAAGAFTLRNGAAFTSAGDFANVGTVTIEFGSAFTASGTYAQSNGLTSLVYGSLVAVLVDVQAGVLEGSGFITGDVVNAGRLIVGGVGVAGGLYIFGNYTQTATGQLDIELGGLTPEIDHDFLYIDGAATLDGALNIALLGEYRPAVDDFFAFLTTGGGITGDFAAFSGLDLGDGLALLAQNDGFGYGLRTVSV